MRQSLAKRDPLVNQVLLGVVQNLAVQNLRTRTELGLRSGMDTPSTDPGLLGWQLWGSE